MPKSIRVHVTVPPDLEGLLNWYVQHDERFKDNMAAAVAHFFAIGINASYEEGLRAAESFDADEFDPLAEQQRRALADAE